MSIFDAAMAYREDGVPLVLLAGKEYGTGSSRDWAAKGPALLGVRAVIAAGYERIHRSNLLGMGVLPLQFPDGKLADDFGIDGTEVFDIDGLANGLRPGGTVRVTARSGNTDPIVFEADVRIDTEVELTYYQNGGILQTVLRQMLEK
jgi:aconitate hydratase